MAKKFSKIASLVPAGRKIEHFSKIAPTGMKLPGKYRAVFGLDAKNRPSWFLFDSYAFWELICRIDEKLFEALPDDKYEVVSLGKLIDKLEEHWPFSEEYKDLVRQEYEGAIRDIKAGRLYSL